MGPTASGKTALAEALADRTGAQLISADAFQVYRGFDIGTAKPSDPTRYRMIDILDPHEEFGVGEWIGRVVPDLDELFAEGRSAILVGGTGYYVRALLDGYDQLYPPPPAALRAELMAREDSEGLGALVRDLEALDPDLARRTDLHNPVRVRRALERSTSGAQPIRFRVPAFRTLKVSPWVDPEVLDIRIADRTRAMLAGGWQTEVTRLREQGVTDACPAYRAIGYKTLTDLLERGLEGSVAFAAIDQETRQYAKRQRTWLRGERNLHWLGTSHLSDPTVALVAHLEALLHRGDTNRDG